MPHSPENEVTAVKGSYPNSPLLLCGWVAPRSSEPMRLPRCSNFHNTQPPRERKSPDLGSQSGFEPKLQRCSSRSSYLRAVRHRPRPHGVWFSLGSGSLRTDSFRSSTSGGGTAGLSYVGFLGQLPFTLKSDSLNESLNF